MTCDFAVDVALCDAELSMRVDTSSAAAAAASAHQDDLWSPWHTSSALEWHIKSIRRSLSVAVSVAVTMDLHEYVYQPYAAAFAPAICMRFCL